MLRKKCLYILNMGKIHIIIMFIKILNIFFFFFFFFFLINYKHPKHFPRLPPLMLLGMFIIFNFGHLLKASSAIETTELRILTGMRLGKSDKALVQIVVTQSGMFAVVIDLLKKFSFIMTTSCLKKTF